MKVFQYLEGNCENGSILGNVTIKHRRSTNGSARLSHSKPTATAGTIKPYSKQLTWNYDFLVTVKVAPHECVIRTGKPLT